MVVMVGGKIVPNGSNYNAILTTMTGGPAYMSEEKEEVSSVQDVEAEVVDEEEEEDDEDEDDDETREFENFVKNQLPMQINQEEKGSPAATNKTDPPAGLSSPTVAAAKAAVAAAVAGLDDDDDGGGKPAATPKKPRAPRTPHELRTDIDPDKDAKFLATVEQLKEFKRINGHCNVPYLRPPHLTTLMSWCHSQRRLYRTGKMHPARLQLLESVGFRWNADKRGAPANCKITWNDRLQQLKDYKAKHGTLEVERETLLESEMQLINWCATQRQNYHAAKLPAEKIQQLDVIGFDWGEPITPKKREPGSNKRPLLALTNGDAGTPGANPAAKRTKLNSGAPAAADATAIVPVPDRPPTPIPDDEPEWVEMLEKLKSYISRHKTKGLPKSFPGDKALDRWVRHQKLLLKKEDLQRSRMERLVLLGFELPAGVTKATYRRRPPPAPKGAASKKSPLLPKKGPAGTPQPGAPAAAAAAAAAAPGAAKAPPTETAAQATKAPPTKFPPAPPGVIPGAPPQGVAPPGAFPGMPWNPFMFTNPYGHVGMYPALGMNPYMQAQQQQAPKPGQKAAAASKNASPPAAAAIAPNNELAIQQQASKVQQESLQWLQKENAELRAQNEQLQRVHSSVMTSLEEEKMIRRQGNQELQAKIDKQEQTMTIQASTIKKQGQQIKQLMDQMKDVVARQKILQKFQEEQEREKEEQRRIQQEEERRQMEIQRQREMQELQRQREEAEQHRRHQEEQRRQNDQLHFLRTQFGL